MEDPMAVWGMWFSFGMMLLISAIIIVVVWQLFATRRANAVIARDEAYKKLAEQIAESQQQTAEDLTELKERVARIETVLKEVE